jgi:hypothetical protein
MDSWNPTYESTAVLKTIYKTNTIMIKIYKQRIEDMVEYDESLITLYKNNLQLYEQMAYGSLYELIMRNEDT